MIILVSYKEVDGMLLDPCIDVKAFEVVSEVDSFVKRRLEYLQKLMPSRNYYVEYYDESESISVYRICSDVCTTVFSFRLFMGIEFDFLFSKNLL